LDNTDSNLRLITQSANMQNYKGAHVDSISGVRGVAWENSKKKVESADLC
jgi:hypothetical protein